MENHAMHQADESAVCYKIGIIFVVILALLILLSIMN